jgi:signal transduction histidine kinase
MGMMVSTLTLTFALLLINSALLLGFLCLAFLPVNLSFAKRVRLLRWILLFGLLVLAAASPLRHFAEAQAAVACLGVFVLGMTALLICRTPQATKKQRDPVWLEGYVTKLESELTERRGIERELAFMASIAERDPNCVIELGALGELGYRNPAADSTFPDLKTLGSRHPIFAGFSDVMELIHREGKTTFRRPVRYADRVYEQQITWSAESQKLGLYMTDVTEWKRLDQLKTDLLNTVSHEFRTPLSSILAAVKMVNEQMLGPVNDDQKRVLSMASESTLRLNRLINDLLDISKVEAGKLDLRRDVVDVADLVEKVAASFEPMAKERGLVIKVDIQARPVRLIADSDKITQVLTNLANNALKFTEKGEVRFVLRADDKEVRLSVEDTGKGIAEEQLHRVFGKFQQLGKSVRGEKGTGLGLSLCKSLVELHQGKIWVESQLHQGSQFIFTIPRMTVQNIFDGTLERLYEESAAAGRCLSAFILQLQEAEGVDHFENKEPLAAALEARIRKEVKSDMDLVLRDQTRLYFILNGIDKMQAKSVMESLVTDFIPVAAEAGALDQLVLRAQFTSLPDDGTILEGLQAKLAA